MNIRFDRTVLGAVIILIIAIGLIITIATRGPEVSLKVMDNFNGAAFIEITATEHDRPFNGNITVYVKKLIAGGHECDNTLSIPVENGKATFKMWGKSGKASWIEVRAGSDKVAFEITDKS